MAKKYTLLFILLLFIMRINAQVEKIDTDRPDQTESVYTVPKHYFQAEFGFNKENIAGKNYDLVYPTALLRYGLTKFEFRLEATYRNSYEHLIPNPVKTKGIDPLEIGFKTELWEEKKWIPKTSFLGGIGLGSIASKAFKTNHLAPSFSFSMQNSITKNAALGYNLGAEWDGFSSTPFWIYTFAPGFNIGEKWYAYAEVFGSIRKNALPQHNLDTGVAYYINNNIKIDLSAGVGISSASPKNYIAVGGSFRCNTKRKK